MKHVALYVSKENLEKHQNLFNSPTFTKVLNELNIESLGSPKRTDIVSIVHLPNDEFGGIPVTETTKLMDFGSKAQIVLKHYEIGTDIGEVVQIWVKEENDVIFKEYSGDKLLVEHIEEELYDVYQDFLDVSQVSDALPNSLIQPAYDPASCLLEGSCCYFEGKRYEHCGHKCGIYEVAGGGTPINAIDSCCKTHDIEIRGKKGKDRCQPHKNFIKCTNNLSGPGYHTIRNGIRIDAGIHLCGWIG